MDELLTLMAAHRVGHAFLRLTKFLPDGRRRSCAPQMIYIVRFVYVGCGVNALSAYKTVQIQYIAGKT